MVTDFREMSTLLHPRVGDEGETMAKPSGGEDVEQRKL